MYDCTEPSLFHGVWLYWRLNPLCFMDVWLYWTLFFTWMQGNKITIFCSTPLLFLEYFKATTNCWAWSYPPYKSVLLISDVLFSYFCSVLLFKAHILQKPNLSKCLGQRMDPGFEPILLHGNLAGPNKHFMLGVLPSGRTCICSSIWPKRRIALRVQETRNGRLLSLKDILDSVVWITQTASLPAFCLILVWRYAFLWPGILPCVLLVFLLVWLRTRVQPHNTRFTHYMSRGYHQEFFTVQSDLNFVPKV
jgi:hypothetical protein